MLARLGGHPGRRPAFDPLLCLWRPRRIATHHYRLPQSVVSHTINRPSSPADTTLHSPSVNTAGIRTPVWPRSSRTTLRVATSQIRITASSVLTRKYLPSGLNEAK